MDCDRRESPEGATPVCGLVRNDSIAFSTQKCPPRGLRGGHSFTLRPT